MKSLRLLIAAASLLASLSARAETASIEQVYELLAKTVEFKKFRTEQHGVLPSGVRYDFFRTRIINDVTRNADKLTFRMSWNIRQDLFDPMPDGSFSTTPHNRDRVGVSLCTVSKMRSTGELAGACEVLYNSMTNVVSVDNLKIEIVDGAILMTTTTASYGDFFSTGDTYLPGRQVTTTRYFVNAEGKTAYTEAGKSWFVDPKTLEPVTEPIDGPVSTVVAD